MKETRASKTRQRTRIGKPMRKSLFDNQLENFRARGFTLIELLVVVSIIAVLLAILLPTAQRIRREAKAVLCQSKLRQWGTFFSMYLSEYDGKVFVTGCYPREWAFYCPDPNRLLLCPMAPNREYVSANHSTLVNDGSTAQYQRAGGTFMSWQTTEGWKGGTTVPDRLIRGSYGMNAWMPFFYGGGGEGTWRVTTRSDDRVLALFKRSARMPLLLDCTLWFGKSTPFDEPPPYERLFAFFEAGMSPFCINRHDGGINVLFLDLSVGKVGLKELWTLSWAPECTTHGPWTQAGGVRPEDWPAWMRHFKDY
jgi:prepilin-type N-terminal cleavage/methylation domain-containing protein/prepilin-type processing-associated H-X9-DG protein